MIYSSHLRYEVWDEDAMRVLDSFLPDRIFDAHAHLLDTSFTPKVEKAYGAPLRMDAARYVEEMSPLLGNPKEIRLNFFANPDPSMAHPKTGNLEESDAFLLAELEKNSNFVAEILIRPEETAEELEKRLVHPRIRGLKCYHSLLGRSDTMFADVEEYLPEAAWEVANARGLVITLHLVKDAALSDPKNLSYVIDHAKRYPNVTLILAHAARAFAAWTGIESVDAVAKLDNVWYDFSSVCESPAMLHIMNRAGVEKCMWGSDYPICRGRGKPISLADTFYWIMRGDLERFSSKSTLHHWLIGIENLMATRQACILADLNEDRVEDLFFKNAERLFS